MSSDSPFKGFTSKEMLFPGVWVYRNAIKKEARLIERLEEVLENSNGSHSWKEAMVGYQEKIPEYRDCFDFKIQKNKYAYLDPSLKIINDIWQDSYDCQIDSVEDYCSYHNIKMDYWEAMNFVKYGVNQHFQEHADHGFSYMATVSLVGYPNDNYEGGELYFPKLNLNIKPTAGDLYIFPSTYLFSHKAMPVKEGMKYSIVTMLDYNDNAHNPEYDQLRAKRISHAQN